MIVWIIAIHSLALGLLALSLLSGWQLLILAAVVLCALAASLRQWRYPGYTSLRCRDGSWTLLMPDGEKAVELISHQWFVGLQLLFFREGRRRWNIALLPDSASATELRRLRQLLLLGRANSS